MKRLLTTLTLAIVMVIGTFAANPVDDIFDEFKKYDDVTHIKIPRLMVKLGRMSCGLDDPISKKAKSVEILTMSDAGKNLSTKFADRLDSYMPQMDEIARVHDDDTTVRIFTKDRDGNFEDIYLFVSEPRECTFIKVSGKFSKDDIMHFAQAELDKHKD
jgi:hypothetical protein